MNEAKVVQEDQPLPPEGASPEANARFQEKVNALGVALTRKFQLGGNQFNVLEMEIRVLILVEQMNLLTDILKKNNPAHTDETLTDAMSVRVERMTKDLIAMLEQAPRLAIAGGALPSRMNGSKHN